MQQEDIGFPHLRIVESLAFIGVSLTANWQRTKRENMNELTARVKSTVGAWKSGKFQSLVCRPHSVNTYCLSKIWFRTHTIDMREGDIKTISSIVKKYIYQGMFEKPAETLLFRPVSLGGLGLSHIGCKALASRLVSFLQTAANNSFQPSTFHRALYSYYCCNDDSLGIPALPPYYPDSFLKIIRDVKEKTPLNPVRMSVKEWYHYLLEERVTHSHSVPGDLASPLKLVKTRAEENSPELDWPSIYKLSRQKGLDMDKKTFLFKLINNLLGYKERLAQHQPQASPACQLCPAPQPVETASHFFFDCQHNNEAGQAVISLILPLDQNFTKEKAFKCEINCDAMYETAAILILATGLELIHRKRKDNKRTSVAEVRAELESLCGLLRRARAKRLREAADMVRNQITNFM